MRMRFIGEYTNERDTITYLGCTFTLHDVREVPDDVFALLGGHPEFEVIDPLDHDADGKKGGSRPRGRPRKVTNG
jgi:hypothetical protein